MKKKIVVFFILILTTIILIYKFFDQKETQNKKIKEIETFNSNLLENVEYISKDAKGNEYIIRASQGEIDLNDSNIIFLEDVRSLIKLVNSDIINITSKDTKIFMYENDKKVNIKNKNYNNGNN